MSAQPESLSILPASETASRKKLGQGLMALALVSSLIASTCCVIPLLLVLAGITGAWMTNLTALKPLTPVFTAVAIGAISWAGYLIWRPAGFCAISNGVCATVRPATKRVFIMCAVFIALLLLFPLAAPLFY